MARTLVLAGKIGPAFGGAFEEVVVLSAINTCNRSIFFHRADVMFSVFGVSSPLAASYEDAVAEHVNKDTPISDVWSGNPDTDKY